MGAEIIIVIVVIVALIGILAYFAYVYMQDKTALTNAINNTENQLNVEQSNRLSSIQYVVDQVNTVNGEIATSFSTSNAILQQSIGTENSQIMANINAQNAKTLQFGSNLTSFSTSNLNKQAAMNAGFGQYITFGSGINPNAYNLFNLPASPTNPNLNLMTQVNLMMGMTANNLSPVGSNVQFCFGPDNKTCSSFPDTNGDITINAAPTDTTGKNGWSNGRSNAINLKGPTNISGSTTINGATTITGNTNNIGNLNITGSTGASATGYTDANKVGAATNALNICNTDGTKCASLSIDSTGNLLINNQNGNINLKDKTGPHILSFKAMRPEVLASADGVIPVVPAAPAVPPSISWEFV